MGTTLEADTDETALPLELTVSRLGGGGVTGLTPTVALRKAEPGVPSYLDWADSTFKTAGWTTKYASMTAIENGVYQKMLNLAVLSPAVTYGMKLSAEYKVDASAYDKGEDADVILVTNVPRNANYLRKIAFNRLEEHSGNPGTLKLYDDDGTTVLTTWTLLDENGNAVVPAVGTPARRSQGT